MVTRQYQLTNAARQTLQAFRGPWQIQSDHDPDVGLTVYRGIAALYTGDVEDPLTPLGGAALALALLGRVSRPAARRALQARRHR